CFQFPTFCNDIVLALQCRILLHLCRAPVTTDAQASLNALAHYVTGQQLANPGEKGGLIRHEARSQELGQHGAVELRPLLTAREYSLDFRREGELLTIHAVVQRFDAETIARQKQTLLATIPNGEGKHA